VGDVGPTQYVEMVNTAWAVYSKTGSLLLGPLSLASLWTGFEVPDCADNSGDPIVVHDQLADRWILTQFSALGPTYYNCVAVSTTGGRDRQLLPVRLLHRRQLPRLPQVRGLAQHLPGHHP
jgi:hypothetical protein